MAFDFPSAPSNGQEYTSGASTYVWNGYGWAVKNASSVSEYVKKVGDTMTGTLMLATSSPAITFNKSAAGFAAGIWSMTNGNARWQIQPGNTGAESGSNAGSDFGILRYNDAGNPIDTPFSINRASAAINITGDLTINKSDPMLILNKSTTTQVNDIRGYMNGSARWIMRLGSGTGEPGSNAGTDFELYNLSDAGTLLGSPLNINRATGNTTLTSLWINPASSAPILTLNKFGSGVTALIEGRMGGTLRWAMHLGDGSSETGSAAGSNFLLTAYNDAGARINDPITITRANGNVGLIGNLTITKSTPNVILNKPSGDIASQGITTQVNGVTRWFLQMGYGPESGGNAGTDFYLTRYSDGGALIDHSIYVYRASGEVTLGGKTHVSPPSSASGNLHLTYVSTGAGTWYDSQSTVNKAFLGMEAASNQFRLYSPDKGNIWTTELTTGLTTYNQDVSFGALIHGNNDVRNSGGTMSSSDRVYTVPANGGTLALGYGSGLVLVTSNNTGSTGLYIVGGGPVALIAATQGTFVAGAGAANQIGLYYDGAGYYRFKNNYTTDAQLYIQLFVCRPSP